MTITIPGYSTLTGQPEMIVKLMQDARFMDSPEGEDYIEEITRTAWRCFGISLQVTGETAAERAESLLREMEKNNMIEIKED